MSEAIQCHFILILKHSHLYILVSGMGVMDAIKASNDWTTKIVLFGEAKRKYTRYTEVRDRLKLQPLTAAERQLVETADHR